MKLPILTFSFLLPILLLANTERAGDQQLVTTSNPYNTNPWEISTLAIGQVIELKEINFGMDKYDLDEASKTSLTELRDFLVSNKSVSIELGDHANSLPPTEYCDKLSSNRANAVRDYLIEIGVNPDIVTAKGYGKRVPRTNDLTVNSRIANQRVEVKILSL